MVRMVAAMLAVHFAGNRTALVRVSTLDSGFHLLVGVDLEDVGEGFTDAVARTPDAIDGDFHAFGPFRMRSS